MRERWRSWFAGVMLGLCFVGVAGADERSEQAAADLLRRKLARESPGDAQLLKGMSDKDIVVVQGSMDHIEQVLRAAQIKHTVIQPNAVAAYQFRASMVVMVDCPGVMPSAGVQRLERHVRAGGLLYTTDWALQNVVQKAFPRTIRATGGSTGDEVVAVQLDDAQNDNIMSKLLLRKSAQPQWWLEGGSYPIRVLDPARVDVLAHSNTMGKRYGAAPVVVRFKHGDGEVIHVVSHFYRQAATSGPKLAAASATEALSGLSDEDKQAFGRSAAAQAPISDVESSYATQRMTTNLVAGKQRRNAELDREYNQQTIGGEVELRATPSSTAAPVARPAAGAHLKVLSRKGDRVQVRDDAGNEGWLGASQLKAR